MNATLERTTFSTSRLMEFFTEKELQMQIGHARRLWPLALVKELVDNALDACETARIAPAIRITVEPDAVSVQDNGPGLPVSVLERSLDYAVRVSDKSQYVSPSRGQLGNALKCLWAAPFVVDGEHGCIEVTTGGVMHRVDVSLDRIAQAPQLAHSIYPDGLVKTGTLVRMHWPQIAGYLDDVILSDSYNGCDVAGIRDLVDQYAVFNPHATVTVVADGEEQTVEATDAAWRKWLPSSPTSPHWYTDERLRALMAAYVADERSGGRARTVREFIAEFAGLSGTAKQKTVAEAAGLSGAYLHDLVQGNDVSLEPVRRLLVAMRDASRPVKPGGLGIIGEGRFTRTMVGQGVVAPASIRYRKVEGDAGGVPFVLEAAFGVLSGEFSEYGRSIAAGLNWSPALRMPFSGLPSLLAEAQVDDYDPVQVVVHLACPRLDFTDRGKAALALPPEVAEALATAVKSVAKDWTVHKRRVARSERMREHALEEMRRARQRRELSIKQAAYRVMEEAYLLASDNGRLPANARQVMYSARPRVLQLTGGKSWTDSSSFTQTLLPDFVDEHPDLTASWDVVFDARGHLAEPHTGKEIGLGTLEVRRYEKGWTGDFAETLDRVSIPNTVPTLGPTNRYRFVLFVEKEGFNELLAAKQMAERYDLAMMSTKGMSVTASRRLLERLSAQGVTVLVLHDLDTYGISILHTLRTDTRRYRFKTPPRVVDLGLRLADVQAMNLQTERVEFKKQRKNPCINLRRSGATEAECDFLVRGRSGDGWWGERVELNAMTSLQFIAFLERKLAEAGVTKVVPDTVTLAKAYLRAWRRGALQLVVDQAVSRFRDGDDESIAVPDDLAGRIRQRIEGTDLPWDAAIRELARDAVAADRNRGRIAVDDLGE